MPLLRDVPNYLSVEDLQRVAQELDICIAGVKYTLEIFEDEHEGPAVYFVCDVVDSYNPPDSIELRILSYLSPNDRLSADHFLRYVLYRLKRIQIHEVGEGLHFRGNLVWNPHDVIEPGGKNA